jgi:crossover junction endodeoxyribonuclease RuvC
MTLPPAAQTDLLAAGEVTAFGVDPGSRKCGWGVVRRRGRSLEHVASGVLWPQASRPQHWRLGFIGDRLGKLLAGHAPHVVGCEDTFLGRNPKTALVVGAARGVVMERTGLAGLPLQLYPPASVKLSVAGHGAAKKPQVQRRVRMLLRLDGELQEDQADALAVAICAALSWRRR